MISYRWIDKRTWDDGPWMDEPDKVSWVDEATGLPCLAVRHPEYGQWCGYVGVRPGHPLHRVSYGEITRDIDVHGGLTYSAGCDHRHAMIGSVCHTPAPGERDDVWWLGFDCIHAFDLAPGMRAKLREYALPDIPGFFVEYKTLGYVRNQTTELARQLAVMT